jgi:poly(A) polymerase
VSFDAHKRRLLDAEWLGRPDTQELMRLLDGEAGRTRAVGGIVRDTVLDIARTRTDVDLATELTPQEVTTRAANAGVSVYPTGVEHGTVTLKLNDLVAEVTTLREDIETDGRRAVVRFGTDWARDAGRRDFTLNALYAGMDGTLFDPLGGLAGRVRFIGDPAQRIEEDRLRVYRFFRFSASHGAEKFDAEGLDACRAAAGRLDTVSAERVGAEMKRMLSLHRVGNTLRAMTEAGILALSSETVRQLHSYERRAHHPDIAARLALIMAELGAPSLRERWRLSNDDVDSAQAILAVAALIRDFRLNEAAYRHPAALADGVEVAAVLAGWTEAGKSAVMQELQSLDVPRFPVGGDDLIRQGFEPGRTLGAELDRLEQLWIGSSFSLTRDQLLAEVRRT